MSSHVAKASPVDVDIRIELADRQGESVSEILKHGAEYSRE